MKVKGALAVLALVACSAACAAQSGADGQASNGTSPPAPRADTPSATRPAAVTGDGAGAPTNAPTAATSAPAAPDATKSAPPVDPGAPAAPGASKAPWRPVLGQQWQIQFSGGLDTSVDVNIFDIDLFDTTAETIRSLQHRGPRVVCYFSAGTIEDWRPDAHGFANDVIGGKLPKWRGERWLDVRAASVRNIMRARLDLAVSKGCDAVDPDNVDAYRNDNGLGITEGDQLDYNLFLAAEAHSRGLAVGLKNDPDQVEKLAEAFDFAVTEECFAQGWCSREQPFVAIGKPVVAIEYGSSERAVEVCPQAVSIGFDALIKNLELDATRFSCR